MLELLGRIPENSPNIVKAFEAIADRGGYIAADKSANFVLGVAHLPNLSDEQKREVISRWMRTYRDDDDDQCKSEVVVAEGKQTK